MKKSLGLFLLALSFLPLMACQQRLKFNEYSEKDCYYSDYWQSSPPYQRDRDYYHSDPIR